VSLVDGALFFDPIELRGQRIGTYLMNEIVVGRSSGPRPGSGRSSCCPAKRKTTTGPGAIASTSASA
jgi:hypothetical protein